MFFTESLTHLYPESQRVFRYVYRWLSLIPTIRDAYSQSYSDSYFLFSIGITESEGHNLLCCED